MHLIEKKDETYICITYFVFRISSQTNILSAGSLSILLHRIKETNLFFVSKSQFITNRTD